MLEVLVKQEIEEKGPLSQSRFMELALHHPSYGYYCTHEAVGRDFTTAPEVSQMFGELLGVWALDYYEKLGRPENLILIELGPGKGTLMADFLRTAQQSPSFFKSLDLHLVEINPLLRQVQEKMISHPSLTWYERAEDIPMLRGPFLIIANEFFDTLPTNCYVRTKDYLYERCVGIAEGKLSFMLNPLRGDQGPDQIWEENPATVALLKRVGAWLLSQGGAFLFLDYGYEEDDGESLSALYERQPSDPLSHVGRSDLSCHVNFGHLKKVAISQGLSVLGPLPQGQFLKNMGLDVRTEILKHKNPSKSASLEAAYVRLTHPQQMGVLFKAMAVFPPAFPKPTGFEA